MPLEVIARFPAHLRGAAFVAALLLAQLALTGPVQSQSQSQSQDGVSMPPAEPPPVQLAPSDVQPATPPPVAPPPAAPQPSGRPGLIDKLGDLLRDSAEGVSSGLKDTQQRIQDINKGTVDTLTSIPVAGFASGRSLCPVSANGSPDCYAATEKLCKDKGYNAGRSLDTETAETCNPRIYVPGYKRKEGDCRMETFVTRAACQ
jgi:hypothetical protein